MIDVPTLSGHDEVPCGVTCGWYYGPRKAMRAEKCEGRWHTALFVLLAVVPFTVWQVRGVVGTVDDLADAKAWPEGLVFACGIVLVAAVASLCVGRAVAAIVCRSWSVGFRGIWFTMAVGVVAGTTYAVGLPVSLWAFAVGPLTCPWLFCCRKRS